MAGRVNVDYDIEEVLPFCENAAQTDIHNLVSDLNKLTQELEDCQDKFHCKGGDNANAVIKIYKGFADAIGKNSGLNQGSGTAGLAVGAARIVNTCYSEAKADLKAQEAAQYSGLNW